MSGRDSHHRLSEITAFHLAQFQLTHLAQCAKKCGSGLGNGRGLGRGWCSSASGERPDTSLSTEKVGEASVPETAPD